MIEVVHFQRKPASRNFSIERLFGDVRGALPSDIRCRLEVSPELSRGLLPRWRSVRAAKRLSGEVNHITGDVHFLAMGLPGRRTILSVMDCGNLHRLRGLRRELLRYFWFTLPQRRVRFITTISEATRRELVSLTGVPADKVRVIHCCVSPAFQPRPRPFEVARPRVLMLGTAPNKNLPRLAEALGGLSCDAELIGRPTPEQEESFARAGVALTCFGDVTDAVVLEAYARCDLVLFASTHEGFGLPIVEAQAIGRPVITSNCSSMPEVAGDAACLVDPNDVVSIRQGVQRVINDGEYRGALVERGFGNVRRFDAAEIAGQYARLYRETAAANRNSAP